MAASEYSAKCQLAMPILGIITVLCNMASIMEKDTNWYGSGKIDASILIDTKGISVRTSTTSY